MSSPQRRYRIVKPVGKGGFGTVYHAQLIGEGGFTKDVAVKLMNGEADDVEELAGRHRDEARLLGLIRHRAILQVDGLVRLNGTWAVVMEYVDGANLLQVLKAGPLPLSCAMEMGAEVAGALRVAHSAKRADGAHLGLVHRDIKPGNILLEHGSTGMARVRVADFGVASVASSNLTHEGCFIGTPMYMSPEQAQGEPVTAASDIYSLGVVMYRLFTGVKPFEADTPVALAMCHVNEPVRPMREVAPIHDIPEELDRLVLKCMAKNPADRFQSCEELLEQLAEVRVTLLPHLLGLSQESLEPLLITADREPTDLGAPGRIRALIGMNVLALGVCFAAGMLVSHALRPAPTVQSVEVERVVEVPVLPEETIVQVVQAPPAAAPAVVAPPAEAPVAEVGVVEAAAPPAEATPVPEVVPPAVQPLVGYGGIDENWVGDMEGRSLELDLEGSPDGQVVGRLRVRSGPGWSTRDLVGRVVPLSSDRVRLTLVELEGKHPSSLSLDVVQRVGRGALTIGDKSRSVTVTPR